MKKLLILATALLSVLFASCDKEAQLANQLKEMEAADDLIITEEVADITANSAVLYGRVGKKYMDLLMDIGIILSTSADPSLDNGIKYEGEYGVYMAGGVGQQSVFEITDREGNPTDGKFPVHAKELSPSTTYYYRAYFTMKDWWEDGQQHHLDIFKMGEVKSFTTLASE